MERWRARPTASPARIALDRRRQHRAQLFSDRRRSQRRTDPGQFAGDGRDSESAPGTLPPVVLPFDPTSTVPVCLVALNSKTRTGAVLYDVGVRSPQYDHEHPGRGGAGRLWRQDPRRDALPGPHQNAGPRLSPTDVMNAMDNYNLFLPTGSVKFGPLDYAVNSNSMFDFVDRNGRHPVASEYGNAAYCATWPRRKTRPSSRPTSYASTAAARFMFRSTGNWGPAR